MGRVQEVRRRIYGSPLERCRHLKTRINEDHQLPILEIQRMLYLQLKVRQDLNTVESRGFDSLGEERPEGIVPAAWITDRQHQYRRNRRVQSLTICATVSPDASRSSTENGILPRA
jgi:hypothetical protein